MREAALPVITRMPAGSTWAAGAAARAPAWAKDCKGQIASMATNKGAVANIALGLSANGAGMG